MILGQGTEDEKHDLLNRQENTLGGKRFEELPFGTRSCPEPGVPPLLLMP